MLASPGSVGNSSSYEAMCLYHRAALGYLAASGAEPVVVVLPAPAEVARRVRVARFGAASVGAEVCQGLPGFSDLCL